MGRRATEKIIIIIIGGGGGENGVVGVMEVGWGCGDGGSGSGSSSSSSSSSSGGGDRSGVVVVVEAVVAAVQSINVATKLYYFININVTLILVCFFITSAVSLTAEHLLSQQNKFAEFS